MVFSLFNSTELPIETAVQLSKIADAPPKIIPPLSDAIAKAWVTRKTSRPLSELIKKLGTKCSARYLKDGFNSVLDTFKKLELDPSNKESYDKVIRYKFQGLAVIIVDGYDIALSENLIKDSSGNVIGVRPQDKARLGYCIPSVSTSVNPADPYKGSMQGKGRKRRKTRKLGRRKSNRNMHRL
jgi:hypothetical protein